MPDIVKRMSNSKFQNQHARKPTGPDFDRKSSKKRQSRYKLHKYRIDAGNIV